MGKYVVPTMGNIEVVMAEDFVVWYVVLVAILLALAATIVAACILYCETKGKHFVGSWNYTDGGGSVNFGCR
jgi:hypothetical protein